MIDKLKKNKSRVSLFIEPNPTSIKDSKILNADCVEIHTGKLCKLINYKESYNKELKKIRAAVDLGMKLGLEIHAGHGLTFGPQKFYQK